MPEFDYGMMVLAESGIHNTPAYNYGTPLRIRRELFYSKPDLANDLHPFALKHTAFQFMFLIFGLCIALIAFLVERKKHKM